VDESGQFRDPGPVPDLAARIKGRYPQIFGNVADCFGHRTGQRARSDNPRERIFRRAYNYEDHLAGDPFSRSGLIFTSFQNDVSTQFVPIQQRLDELDLLNEWVVPVGSAVFAIPPGCGPDGFIGETLFG
jgi:deferrochelatase/peroxidase EfeB